MNKQYSLSDVSKVLAGDIKIYVEPIKIYGTKVDEYGNIESYTTNTIFVGKKQRDGDIKCIAKIYKHYCGEIVVIPADTITLSLNTLEKTIIPIMKDYYKIIKPLSKKVKIGKKND